MTTTLAQHFLMVPLTLFTMVVPLPFGALGLSEGVGDQVGNSSGTRGALAMLGFRVLMYACGLISACVYLANLREVRSLTPRPTTSRKNWKRESLDDAAAMPASPAS